MRTFAQDYKFGTSSEVTTLSAIQSLDSTIERSKETFHPFDYINREKTVFVELKTRTNTKDAYPTTMIPHSKVKIAEENPDKTYYFAFKFVDGLYYIQYSKDRFANYEVKQGGRFDRGRPELNQYVYIPVADLTALSI